MGQQEKTEFIRNFSQTLRAIRTRRGWSQAELAEKLEVAPSAVSNWESMQNGPTRARLKQIAERLGVSIEYLSGEAKSDVSYSTQEQPLRTATILKEGRDVQFIPVVSWASAGQSRSFEEMAGFIDEEIPVLQPERRLIAVKVEGDSMTPHYLPGDVVVLSPDSTPRNGDKVVAKLRGSYGVLFKIYNAAGDRVTLTSYNPAYAPLEFLKPNFEWVYPVVQTVRRERR